MRYTIGITAVLAGLWLLHTSHSHWRQVREAMAAYGPPSSEPPMTMFGEIMRPVILFALAYAGAKTTFAFYWFDASRFLSVFDLGGFWFLLVTYGAYVTVKTKFPRTWLDAVHPPRCTADVYVSDAGGAHDDARVLVRPRHCAAA